MKLELLSASQIKILFEQEDIKKWEISFEDLDYSDQKTRNMFWSIMEKAYLETGFDTKDSKLVIEAISQLEGFTLFVTKIYNNKDYEILKKFLNTQPLNKIRLNTYLFQFRNFEDLLDCIEVLKNRKDILKSSLYYYDKTYYIKLIINKYSIMTGKVDHPPILHVLSEFSTPITTPHFEFFLKEHAQRLVKNNLIQEFSKIFLKNASVS